MQRQRETPLTGKVAVVTGASRGIGKATALSLARRGADVGIVARTVTPRRHLPGTLDATVAELKEIGAHAHAVAADLSLEADLDRVVTDLVDRFGRIDILVNNAAATGVRSWSAPIADVPRKDWDLQFAVNVHAPFTLVRQFAPVMERSGGGRVLNVTTGSPQAYGLTEYALEQPTELGSFSTAALAYLASKAALDRFTEVVAPQLHAMNIAIVNVHPGAVRTELSEHLAGHGLDIEAMLPMDVPARALTYLAACEDPMPYSGRIVVAEHLVDDFDLLEDPDSL